ncbi:MAG: TonB-dependent receptor [Terracidiphilus sp.]
MKLWIEQFKRLASPQWLALALLVLFAPSILAQETTGGIQGTVKDPSGAVVPHAQVVITGTALVGSKQVVTDSSGYYRFANLPPGVYIITATAPGFETLKREGLVIEVGHLPTVELTLKVGEVKTVVEVSTEGPVIDVTTTQNMTNIPAETLDNVPHGISYQSVIQFAPMARNEPLAGMSVNGQGTGGSGGSMPGSSGNGQSFGYSIGGAADSETSYLVEGQDTENISAGYSKANVPMDFIQEVEMKTSGISAEYGGALGGVVNVVMKKGGNDFHGEIFSSYESNGLDGNPVNAFLRYNPLDPGDAATGTDPAIQVYQAQKDHFRTLQPGVVVGGPIMKDRVWFFAGFNPLYQSRARTVNFGAQDGNAGNQFFTQDRQTYFGTARIDAALTQKVRVFGSWLDQISREAGDNLPIGDPISPQSAFLNTSIFSPLTTFSHGLGFMAPNSTYNVGADISLTQKIVSTTRYGYFFDNYHDFGWPTTAPDLVWNTDGVGACENVAGLASPPTNCGDPSKPNYTPQYQLPANLQYPGGTSTTPYLDSYTLFNADKHYQFNQDVAFFKGGWWGTHNLKLGYQLNHLVNVIHQNGNVPYAFMNIGAGQSHNALTQTAGTNCGLLETEWEYPNPAPPPQFSPGPCAGQYGYLTVQDFSTILATPASDWNHAFYAQDSWTVGHGVTLDLGIRIERESLPAPGGVKVSSINFPWSDKIEPRLGVAWDPSGKGKMKIFGSYGVVNDVMKLLLAQTSWGAQAYEQCSYALGPDVNGGFSTSDIDLVFKDGRACPNGPATTQANFANGAPASLTDKGTGISLIENINLRPWEPVAPNVKPYRQHEYVFGVDYQLSPAWSLEARYDRRRVDHIIEDASLSDIAWGETYTVVNPGEGVNSTIDGYATYLASLGQAFGVPGWAFSDTADYGPGVAFGTCAGCPPNPKAVRNYDGVELRVTMAPTRGLVGMFSYTYSSLWGNYTGLTTTDQTDGGTTGRNSPDTTRSFDEPFYYFGANGKSNNGPLPTDRPNVLKGDVYYKMPWKRSTTTVGLFQQVYEGSPVSSYIDLSAMFGPAVSEATYIFGRGKWVNMTTDAVGNITLGTPYTRRTPWYTQSDLNAAEEIKVGEHKAVAFEMTALNALNQRAVTAYWGGMNSLNFATPLYPGLDANGNPVSLASGASLYQVLESGYNPQTWINGNGGAVPRVFKNSQYGQPYLYQNARNVRFALRYTF